MPKEIKTTNMTPRSKSEVKQLRKFQAKKELKAREKAGVNAPKRELPAGPVKKVVSKVKAQVKEAKKILPRTAVIENRNERIERLHTRSRKPQGKVEKFMSSGIQGSQGRDEYVASKKAAGKTVKPRVELKKGFGKNAPVKKRLIP
jgi:hypothetical protein